QTMIKVILPQAIRNILPALGNEFVTIIKDSSLLATIGVMELYNGAQTTSSTTYQSLSPWLLVAVYYFVVTFITSRLINLLEKKLGRGYVK
ncbi:MAG: ABC transporter permease subunit, partial [Lactococcus sp.]|nr:ABC transporter permease subunit [Lactococcus sp.]